MKKKNNPVVSLRVTDVNTEVLDRIFIKEEKESIEWEESLISAIRGFDYTTAQALLKNTSLNINNAILDKLVADLTLDDPNKGRVYSPEFMREVGAGKHEYIKDIEFDDKVYKIRTKGGEFKFCRATDVFDGLKYYFPKIGRNDRYGECHNLSCKMAEFLKSGISAHVVTGYIAPLCNERKFLHTWIEYVSQNEDFVVDLSRNLFMKKEDYYKMRGIKNAYMIPASTVVEEKTLRKQMSDCHVYLGKLYLANRPLAIEYYNYILQQESVPV